MALLAAGCTSNGDGQESAGLTAPASGSPTSASPTSINVMSFNIEYGGMGVDFNSVSKAIEAADADVVAIQEGYGNMPAIAKDLGWAYYDVRTQVVSKYPLLTPQDPASHAVLVQPTPGQVFAMLNVHLSSTGYGPNKVLAGTSAVDMMRLEKEGRLTELEPILDEAKDYVADGIPAFVLGDFNSPSHLDWTEKAVGLREQVAYPMRWPTSVAAADAGFVDSYRSLYPDPVADQGLTWPASRPWVRGYNPGPNGRPADRIDFIYTGGDITTTQVSIVGERKSEYSDISVSPWPGDHRAVVGTYEVKLGQAPTIVSIDQRLGEIGQVRQVDYNAAEGNAAKVSLIPRGGDIADAVLTTDVPPTSGQWQLPTANIPAGDYDIVLTSSDDEELAWTRFWLVESGTPPTITTDRKVFASGDPIEVKWENAPGNRWDWLGVYPRDADPADGGYLLYTYTHATVQGQATLDDDAEGSWPLRPGKYTVYLMQDDSYVDLAGTDFQVTPGDG